MRQGTPIASMKPISCAFALMKFIAHRLRLSPGGPPLQQPPRHVRESVSPADPRHSQHPIRPSTMNERIRYRESPDFSSHIRITRQIHVSSSIKSLQA